MDARLRRPLVGLGLLVVGGNLLGGLLYVLVRTMKLPGVSDPDARVLSLFLILAGTAFMIQVFALAAAAAVGWFVARGPGPRRARLAGSLVAGALGTALFVFLASVSVLPAFEAAYGDLEFNSWTGSELGTLVGLGAAIGAAGALTGALVPVADELLADEGDAADEA